MSVQNTAELIQVKNQILAIEHKMEDLMTDFIRKPKVDYSRTDDYGERGFTLQIFFDSLNVKAFDNADEVKELYLQMVKLKTKQKDLETEYNSEQLIQSELKKDTRNI